MTAPAELVWDDQPASFLDRLVDRDVLYLDAELAVEALIHAGLHDEITITFDLAGHTVHWHRMPALHPGLRPLDIFTMVEQSGLIHVIHIRFADGVEA